MSAQDAERRAMADECVAERVAEILDMQTVTLRAAEAKAEDELYAKRTPPPKPPFTLQEAIVDLVELANRAQQLAAYLGGHPDIKRNPRMAEDLRAQRITAQVLASVIKILKLVTPNHKGS